MFVFQSLTLGLMQQEFKLSKEPELGDWRIQFTAGPVTGRAVFKVAEYVLPKFDVSSHFIETRKWLILL